MSKKKDRFNELFLKENEIIIPKEKWNKLLEVLENHKDSLEEVKLRLKILEDA